MSMSRGTVVFIGVGAWGTWPRGRSSFGSGPWGRLAIGGAFGHGRSIRYDEGQFPNQI